MFDSMAEPSLLCVNCARPPPAHRRTWDRCKLCARRNLPATYYCGEACMEAHWPKHRQYHKEAKELQRKIVHTKPKLPSWLANETRSLLKGLPHPTEPRARRTRA